MWTEKDAPSKGTKIYQIFSLVFLGSLKSGEVEAVNMTIPNTLIRGALGGEALLSVRYSSSSLDPPVIKWQLQREKAVTVVQSVGTDIVGTLRPEYQDRILVFDNGTLLLHNLRLSDDGTYEVEISITDDTFPGEGDLTLTVDEPISRPFIHMESSSVLELTENFVLNCSHDNGTRTTYKWFKGGKPLTNESRFVLSPDQKWLTIPRVLMTDEDIYSCTVGNPLGNMSSLPIRLAVYRRSSVYIILSTGGIFIFITLVTVCACWTPTKKSRQKSRNSRIYGPSHHTQLKQRDDVREHSGIKTVTSLYVLQQKDPPMDDDSSNSIGSLSELDNPPSYTTFPKYTNSVVQISDPSRGPSFPKTI